MITVGTDSWVTIVEADNYLQTKINAKSWFELKEEPTQSGQNSKESFLKEAYYRLLYNSEFVLTASSTNSMLKHAQIEFALFLLQNYKDYFKREAKIASGIKSFSYSKWRESLADSIKIPYYINNILSKAGFSYSNYLVDITVE